MIERKGFESAIDVFPTNRETLRRGWFESKPPILLGKVPNEDEFKQLTDQSFECQPSMGQFEVQIGENASAPTGVPEIFLPVLTIMQKSANNFLAEGEYSASYETYTIPCNSIQAFQQPHIDDNFIVYPERRPSTILRFTVGYPGGSVFYPGTFRFPSIKLDDHLRNELYFAHRSTFKESIARVPFSVFKPIPVESLVIAQFTAVDIHSAPPVTFDQPGNRFLLTVTIDPHL